VVFDPQFDLFSDGYVDIGRNYILAWQPQADGRRPIINQKAEKIVEAFEPFAPTKLPKEIQKMLSMDEKYF